MYVIEKASLKEEMEEKNSNVFLFFEIKKFEREKIVKRVWKTRKNAK